MDVILGVDGGNTKTDLLAATTEGEPLAYVRGPGSNSHAVGSEGCVEVVATLVEQAALGTPVGHGAFFLCGADVPADIAELTDALDRRAWVRDAIVDNDTFALLYAGSESPDAVAVVCGAGLNCVGRSGDGRAARYPSLGWETGDWGGSEPLGRDVVFHAVRGEDGRGEPTALSRLVRTHFDLPSVAAVGEAIHYGRIPPQRVGELAPAVVAAAAGGDAVARRLVGRLADEIVLMAVGAFHDLGLARGDVVLGGGMLQEGFLVEEVVTRLRERLAGARPVVVTEPPVLGAALAALDAAGAADGARERLRTALRTFPRQDVRAG